MLIPFATANNKITARFSDSQAPASQLVSAVFESDSKWQKIAGVGIGESKSIGLASSYNYLTFVEPTGFFLDSLTPRSLAANSITAQLPDKEIINARRITTNAVFLNAAVVSIDEAETQYAIPDGIYSESFGTGDIKYLNFLVTPDGVYRDGISPSSPVSSFVTARLFRKPRLPVTRITATVAYLGAPIVDESFEPSTQHIATYGYDLQLFGSSKVWLNQQHVTSIGINNLDVGRASIINGSQGISVKGWQSSKFGLTVAYNFRQYVYQKNREDQSSYGKPYLQGGVRWLYPRAFDSLNIGKHDALNTTANQELKPGSINSLAIGALNVSPRIVYPSGFYNNGVYTNGRYETIKFGTPDIRDPAIVPKGELQTSYGNQTVWFHTRPLSPTGISSYESGYARVFDPTQFVYPVSLLASAIFGDTATRNLTFKINVPAIYDGAFSDYTTLTNSNRYYTLKGIGSLAVGAASIINKTPSIFPDGINPYDVSLPAIGWRVRSIYPTGFDRLLLGRPTLIKTPELKASGFDSLSIGVTTAWHKNRTLRPSAFVSEAIGGPTTWFRYRYIEHTKSWESNKFGASALTHGLREVIGKGFVRDTYGNAWVSRGVRQLEPPSIYKKFASNHMVGGAQTIQLQGYIATEWLTRIIPEAQGLFPLGFAGKWGLTTIDLYTRYLLPVGYITVGTSASDRWGQLTAYNLTQYVTQNYDSGNGLVPPKWSDWTAIANRNRVIRASGLSSQKFGYSQIDNNAAPLLPKGIEPPVSNNTMVAYAIRSIPADGIKPPLVSSWVVVYNDARVMNPKGLTHSDYGNAGVVNTRRYYRNIGRIDSLETGTPMIAYAIRTIDIEPRYSIAPPQINLPTVDLYTRYIGFQGYETARHGLASLSIHLRIIAPKWVHRDKAGVPALKNLTPELGVYGHNSDEYGRAQIRTQWREVIAQGDNSNVFGLLKIADTKQSIEVRGLRSGISSQRHTVTKTGTNPYVVQNIWLNNESDDSGDGFGIPTDDKFFREQVSRPSLNQNVIYPNGRQSSKFGTIFMWSNNLMIDGGIGFPDNSVPNPMVSNKDRVVAISEGMDYTIEVSEGARLSPHTIYAVMDAPAQAIKNHKPDRLHYVNSNGGNRKPGEVFGRAFVESTIRTIKPRWSSPSSYYTIGRPTLTLSLAVVKPDSFRLSRFGIPSIPFTPQSIVVRAGVYDNVFGITGVKPPPYTGPQYINLKGIYSTVFGATYTDNYVRTLYARGGDSLIMGQKKSNDTPFMWQGLRIGEHVPLIIGGGDMALYGEHRISHWIQEVLSEGFESFRSEYSLESFYDRMTVKNADKKLPALLTINTASINPASAIGYQDVKYGQRYIRPDGNSNQYRKGAPSA